MNSLVQKKYKAVENDFFNFLNKNLKKDLLFYVMTGSVAREDVISGWSDIDILIIIKKYNKKSISIINKALSRNNSKIKIGLTFFSYNSFINEGLYKDPKTLYSFDLIEQGICKPRVSEQKIKKTILKINQKQKSSWYNTASFAGILHDYKRALLLGVNYDEKIVYKRLATLLKIILKQKGMVAHGYDEVFELSKNKLKDFDMNFTQPIYILQNPDISRGRYDEYVKFLRWLEKYPKF
ncbi:MAG: nucleotidyltransferase domain-containing protein [Parcubacteria group bacterium]|jgi:predicted nucleotidyltransferase